MLMGFLTGIGINVIFALSLESARCEKVQHYYFFSSVLTIILHLEIAHIVIR